MRGVSQGNAGELYSHKNNGWIVGFFVNDDPFRQTSRVEMKWKKHQPSKVKKPYEANYSARSMSILIKGSFLFEFKHGNRRKKVLLNKPGDYTIWLPNVMHRGYAQKANTLMLTLRWPSLNEDHYKAT